MNSSEQIWQDYHRGLLNFIRHRVGNQEVAEDLLQDVFVKIHARLETLTEAERIRGWIYSIARNAIIDHYRTRKSSEPLPATLDGAAPEPDEGDAVWRELEECLRPLIEYLPERYRTPLLLAELEGLPLKEVAGRLGLSLPNAKSRVQRGRAKLKEIIHACCQLEFDRRGKPISYKNECTCRPR